jgi:cytochrome c556
MRRSIAATLAVAFAALLAVSVATVVHGQQPPAGAATVTPQPPVPAAANSVLAHPDQYYGQYVSMTAVVEKSLGPTAFSVDQSAPKSGGDGILVLAPRLNAPVDLNSYVTVVGQLVKFDPAEISSKSKDIKVDLPPDIVEKYRGRPVLLASAVINKAYADLAKRLPPPMTADEETLSKLMKQIAPAFAAMRNADDATADATKQNAAVLKQAFTETEAFWRAKGKTDATQWAGEARKQAESIERDAAVAKWDGVKSAAGTLGQSCQSCHTQYRERFDDGSYRIKTVAPGAQ